MIVVIDNYDSFVFNLVHYIFEEGGEAVVLRNDAHTADEILDAAPDGVLISPGPGTPDDAGISLDLLHKAPAGLPIFGVCLGHQAIGQAYGGVIDQAQAIMHGKVSRVTRTDSKAPCPLLAGAPMAFNVTRYHSLSLTPPSVPRSLMVTAQAEDGEIMALRHRSRPVFGVQFHPESWASQCGHQMIGNFLAMTEEWRAT